MTKVEDNTIAGTVRPESVSLATRKRRRPDITADAIRERIVEARLAPGDRIPAQWIAPDQLGVSRGTLREALKILEFQGLIQTRTGPGGGAFVSTVHTDDAIRMLNNLFLFKAPSIADIYALRKDLEPQLAASVAGRLSAAELESLQQKIRLYEDEPETAEEEYRQRIAELDFHSELAGRCGNALLGFVCRFLVSLLQDMTVCREIYRKPNPELRESGLHYQIRLIRAIKQGKTQDAWQIMHDHMIEAEKYMLEMAAVRAPAEREQTKGR